MSNAYGLLFFISTTPSSRQGFSRDPDIQVEIALEIYFLYTYIEEVWVCDEDGLVVFYNARGEIQRSNQFPEFPTTLALDFPPA